MANQPPVETPTVTSRIGSIRAAGAPETVTAILQQAAQQSPESIALKFNGVETSYRSYLEQASQVAAYLRQEYSAQGQRVATILGNSSQTCIAFFGVWLSGAQLMPLNPLYTNRELEQILADGAPVAVVTDSTNMVASLDAIKASVDVPVIDVDELVTNAHQLDATMGETPVISGDDMALLQYTGGTSGAPKGVELTHRAVAANVWQRELRIPMRPAQEGVLCVMPLFHSYAMAMGLFLAAYSQSTLVVMSKYRPAELLERIETERITVFPGNPTIYTGLLSFDQFKETDWGALRTCFSGSAALPSAVLTQWEQETGAAILEGYGQTESGPVLAFPAPGEAAPKGSTGRAVEDTEIQIVDLVDGTQELPAGELGEIIARGPQIMAGYRNRPQETRTALREGWLYTGDIGEIDEDGYLFIRDRKKEMVISGGYNVYPREIEEVLVTHPHVVEAAVIGISDNYRGEVLHAYVVVNDDLGTEDLHAFCSEHLAKYKVPSEIRLLPELPKTTVNKIDKKKLKVEAENEVQ